MAVTAFLVPKLQDAAQTQHPLTDVVLLLLQGPTILANNLSSGVSGQASTSRWNGSPLTFSPFVR